MWKLGAVLAIAGFAITLNGFRESRVADISSATPERITLAQMIFRGPDGNPNIVVTEFEPCKKVVTITGKSGWRGAWVPIVPEGTHAEAGWTQQIKKVPALVYFSGSESEISERIGTPEIRGLMTNNIESIGSDEEQLLKRAYPETDFTKCLIIHAGREPTDSDHTLIMKVGGSVAFFLGVGIIAVPLFRWARTSEDDADRPRYSGPFQS